MKTGKEKLIVAIDTDNLESAKKLVDELENSADIFKVGLEQYIESRGQLVDYLKSKNKKIFLDLKFHDIPNTMQSAIRAGVRDRVWMMTIHVSDLEGMKLCAKAAKEEAEKYGIEKPLIIAVTVLTSMSDKDLEDIGCMPNTTELAIKRAKLAKEAGIDGIVCSAKEVDKILEAVGKDFVAVCPGIRPKSAEVGDQKRIVTPAQAVENGASYLVVGRPITRAENPDKAAKDIVEEIKNAIK
ncbi:MAG: orotidine-5'-phosphate decarboxylase [Clostridioides sp.]|jgi:orotidine-5'-phosphate decarboxylase|nr:orotidine-5'-phosphate decarboxylase [Clostridioides sp.]